MGDRLRPPGGTGQPASLPRPLLGNPIPKIQIGEENE